MLLRRMGVFARLGLFSFTYPTRLSKVERLPGSITERGREEALADWWKRGHAK